MFHRNTRRDCNYQANERSMLADNNRCSPLITTGHEYRLIQLCLTRGILIINTIIRQHDTGRDFKSFAIIICFDKIGKYVIIRINIDREITPE